jgi:putative ABC transport system permease protein
LKNEYQSRGKILTYKNLEFPDYPLERIAMKVKPSNMEETIAEVEEEYKAVFPGTVFNWWFLEDSMNMAYTNEKVTRNQIMLFVILAMVIACLGFQGMITHKVNSKTKELGIRKVLGASLGHIGNVILQPSFIQFGIAILIGLPIAWYLGQQYLQKFSEQIELQWWHFTMPVVLLVAIMLSTISMVIWKAARSNPVEALKHE